MPSNLTDLANAIRAELTDDIVPFWLRHAFAGQGGFTGLMANDLTIDPRAGRGLILNARLLWSFSAFYRHLGDSACLSSAHRAFEYLEAHFWDAAHGGLYWRVDADGRPSVRTKKVYGQAFVLYALAEYHRASGSQAALARAKELFDLLETKARDAIRGGYFEAYERDWTLATDLRLGEDDPSEKKSMNTHLHLLEAYAGLYRSWREPRLRTCLLSLLDVFERFIVDPATCHFREFFDEDWTDKSHEASPGHDIEGSWLLCEAAEIVGDAPTLARVHATALRIAAAVLRDGVDADGGVVNAISLPHDAGPAGTTPIPAERRPGVKDWWPQAESVVGFLNAYELSGEESYLAAANAAWRFIERFVLDRRHGEWFWRVNADGSPDEALPKISEWKCPYHNGRMCLEAYARLVRIESRSARAR